MGLKREFLKGKNLISKKGLKDPLFLGKTLPLWGPKFKASQ